MSRILTQLEEADHILMAKTDHDMEVRRPIPEDVQPSEILREAKRDRLIIRSDISNVEAHKEAEHGFPDPLPYVWSM